MAFVQVEKKAVGRGGQPSNYDGWRIYKDFASLHITKTMGQRFSLSSGSKLLYYLDEESKMIALKVAARDDENAYKVTEQNGRYQISAKGRSKDFKRFGYSTDKPNEYVVKDGLIILQK